MPDVDLDILGWWRSHQLLQPDQPILVLIENCNPGPVEEHHQVLADKLDNKMHFIYKSLLSFSLENLI